MVDFVLLHISFTWTSMTCLLQTKTEVYLRIFRILQLRILLLLPDSWQQCIALDFVAGSRLAGREYRHLYLLIHIIFIRGILSHHTSKELISIKVHQMQQFNV
jgi:hypothetical protein